MKNYKKLLQKSKIGLTIILVFAVFFAQAQVEEFNLLAFGANKNPIPQNFCQFNNSIYFTAKNGNNRYVLWQMEDEQNSFKEISFSSVGGNLDPNPTYLTSFNNALYFSAADVSLNRVLWKLTSNGVEMVSLINFGTNTNPYVSNLYAFGDVLFFTAKTRNGDITFWQMNLEGIASEIAFEQYGGSRTPDAKNFAVFNNALYFNAKDVNGISVLWKYDGNGFTEITLPSNVIGTNPNPKYLTATNDRLYFSALDYRNNNSLWYLDINDQVALYDMVAAGSSMNPNPEYLCFANNYLYLKATDLASNMLLWRIDAQHNAKPVSLVAQGGNVNPVPNFMTQVDNNLYFRARDKNNNWHLWYLSKNDKIKKISFAETNANQNPTPNNLFVMGNKLYFTAKDKDANYQLYRFTENFVISNWNGSWSNGIPNRNTDVVILSDYKTSTEMPHFECLDLDIAEGVSFTIDLNTATSVYGNLVNSGTLKLANQTSSLIVYGEQSNTENGNMQSSKNIVNWWSLVSSPIMNYEHTNSGTISYSYVENSIGNKVAWQENQDQFSWANAKGFLFNAQENPNIEFNGLFHYESLQFAVNKEVYGFNLVGNPYPSALDWTSTAWTDKGNVSAIKYSYSCAKENYTYFASNTQYAGGVLNGATSFIDPMEGFFVLAKSGIGSFKISNLAKAHKDFTEKGVHTGTEIDYCILNVANQNYSDETSIRFINSTTMDFDVDYDAYKLFSFNKLIPQIYTYTNATWNSLAINSQTRAYAGLIIPVGFKAADGTYTLTAKEFAFNLTDFKPILKDNKENKEIELENLNYTFNHNNLDNPDRFSIVFKSTVGIEELSNSDNSIYTFNNQLFIHTSNLDATELEIYDISGKKLFTDNFTTNYENLFDFGTGNYIVKIRTNNEIKVKKVFFTK